MSETKTLDTLLRSYYESYYKNELGLPDWEKRVEARCREEDVWGGVNIGRIEKWLSYDFSGKKVLVVGGGTGAEAICLNKRGAEVYVIEPYDPAVEILKRKADEVGIPPERFMKAYAEDLPFEENEFDFVYCFTVLEHVANVEDTVREMVRVSKVDGWIFIVTPDYRQYYEPHYKMTLPMFMPKWFIKWCLWKAGRPTAFLDTLQLVNARKLAYFFQSLPVLSFQLFHPWPESWTRNPSRREKLIMWITRLTGAQRDQWWFLKKVGK
ncbi:MAG: methyltransferase domain-containing protein [Verrucomicrobiota bacterium]